MDAVEYLKEYVRMANCNSDCKTCSLGCELNETLHPEQAVAIVEQWAKENPVKTYLSVLLEKYPTIRKTTEGLPMNTFRGSKSIICPDVLYGDKAKFEECGYSEIGGCIDCWNRKYKENLK